MRIAVVANTSWYLFNFRLNLMGALREAGHEVIAIGPPDGYEARIVAGGFRFCSLDIAGSRLNPFAEAMTVIGLGLVLRRERVDLVLSYTPKANIYSGLAALVMGVQFVPNISGLGRVFIRPGPMAWLVKQMYRVAFHRAVRVFFQNNEDMNFFVSHGLVDSGKSTRLPGSGVDVDRFSPSLSLRESQGALQGNNPMTDETKSDLKCDPMVSSVVFLLIARMLWDKGIGEYVEAARLIRAKNPTVRFQLLGFADVDNPTAITRAQLDAWVAEGVVEYLGRTDDVVGYIREANCVVLPSFYREGVPRTLLEAASMGKPIVATDASGCRDTVDDGVTGFLCRPKDARNLAEKMVRIIDMSTDERRLMGLRGREKMRREFDERIVINQYLRTIESI